jgi:hypothetical protein
MRLFARRRMLLISIAVLLVLAAALLVAARLAPRDVRAVWAGDRENDSVDGGRGHAAGNAATPQSTP